MSKKRKHQHHRRRHDHREPQRVSGESAPFAGPSTRLRRALESDHLLVQSLRRRADALGGVTALEDLDDSLLPAESFDWSTVRDTDREVAEDVLRRLDAVATELPDEYTTVLRRLLAIACQASEATLRRRSSPERIAAALAWIALKGNQDLGGSRRFVTSADLLWWRFGVTSCSALAPSTR